MKKLGALLTLLVVATLVLSACAPAKTESPKPQSDKPAGWEAPKGALVSYPVETAPTLDGLADDAAWASAAPTVISVAGGANNFAVDTTLKSVYTADTVYFVLTYADTTESWFRSPWQKQEDGTWKQVKDPADKGGDNNTVYEDKMAMIWSINNSIKNFETTGCFTACHAGENGDIKPYGNKYTSTEGELGDIWHWKSVRNAGQIDDQYLDSTKFDAATAKEAGRKSDKKADGSGGYVDNFASMPDPADSTKTVPDNTKPGFSSPAVDLKTGAPGYILDSEKVALDQAALYAMPVGSYLPGIVKSAITGDRGDISAAWLWKDGTWTLEFSRKLNTGSETDVQFADPKGTYYFGLAIFDNAQVRHAFQNGSTAFVFMPKP